MNLEVILTDLRGKFPWLEYVLHPRYTPYLNTAGTVLLGWLIVSWISSMIRSVLAPLTIAAIAIILICPMTTRWYINQTVPGFGAFCNDILEKFQAILPQIPQ